MDTTVAVKLNRKLFSYPVFQERVIQFGTGVLLRGLVDYIINAANEQQLFNGSIVQVKSTTNGSITGFAEQDNLYSVAIRGKQYGRLVHKYAIISAISRTIDANSHWHQILNLAKDERLDIIISNTTEVGLVLNDKDSISAMPPVSYPGKLLALLLERYQFFKGDKNKGYVIIATELISNNGAVLKEAVLSLAKLNNCQDAFLRWVEEANYFCSSLVDRIVSGTPSAEKLQAHFEMLKYEDELLIECEPYILWAIEGDNFIKEKLSFEQVSNQVIVATSIEKYKELKLRLLNGTHTFLSNIALLKGFKYVQDAMRDKDFYLFAEELMRKEIAETLPYDKKETDKFIKDLLDRFSNPYIEHKWHAITLNHTQKMINRNITLIIRYYEKYNKVPLKMAECFAAFIRFMEPVKQNEKKQWMGCYKDEFYLINDPEAQVYHQLGNIHKGKELITAILGRKEWWQTDLNEFDGFADTVNTFYQKIK